MKGKDEGRQKSEVCVEGLRYIGEAGSFQPDEAYFACADRCWLAV